MLLANYHVIRLTQEGKPPLIDHSYLRCFYAVSRVNPNDKELTSMEERDPSLHASLQNLKGNRADNTFPYRQGLSGVLGYAARDEVANVQNHVATNLSDRIKKWLVVLLTREPQPPHLTVKHAKRLAKRMVLRLEHDDEERQSRWTMPSSATDALGKEWLQGFKNPPLSPDALVAIEQVWTTLIEEVGQEKLPLCEANFANKRWMAYFPLLCKILKDTEDAGDLQEAVSDEPEDRPQRAWCERKVKEILKSSRLTKEQKKAADALKKSIIKNRPFPCDRQGLVLISQSLFHLMWRSCC